jgi:hypothetical protein
MFFTAIVRLHHRRGDDEGVRIEQPRRHPDRLHVQVRVHHLLDHIPAFLVQVDQIEGRDCA